MARIKRPNPTMIGGFIIGACLLVLGAICIWGAGHFFEKRVRFVCYFPGSVHGLNVGAPVKYRGVPVGEVVEMRVRYEQPADDYRIPVFIELNGRSLRDLSPDGTSKKSNWKLVSELVSLGMRARLDSESFVTGQLYVNLDLFPDLPAVFVHENEGFPEIPTVPTQLEEITKSLTGIVEQLKRVDLAGIAKSLEGAVAGINKLVNMPSVSRSLDELPAAVAAAKKLMVDLDGGVGTIAPELQAVLDPRGPLTGDMQRTMSDLQHAAQAVRDFADFLRRNPNALLVGTKRP